MTRVQQAITVPLNARGIFLKLKSVIVLYIPVYIIFYLFHPSVTKQSARLNVSYIALIHVVAEKLFSKISRCQTVVFSFQVKRHICMTD